MKIKKAYQSIIDLLEANKSATVADIFEQAVSLASAKVGTGGGGKPSTFHAAEDGTVLAVFDYYFKKWMSPLVVEFGAKKNSASGLNSMCKEGVSNWTKQRREYDKVKETILERVLAGDLSPENAKAEQQTAEQAVTDILPHSEGYGFDSLEACLEDLQERGLV